MSIITPCFNGEPYLDRYFSSILQQTYAPLELIFVNDGSSDRTAEIAESYNEKGLKDINSTEGNRNNSENDYGTAELIISVKTGGILLTTTIIGMIIVMICLAIYFIKLKRRDK